MTRLKELENEKRKDGYVIIFELDGFTWASRYDYDSLLTAFTSDNHKDKVVEFKSLTGQDCHIRVTSITQLRYISSELAELLLEDEAENLLKGN